MLYYGFDEQARHEHMSDEYKDRYIIIALLKTPPRYYRQYNTTVSSNTDLNKRVVRSSTTKDLPNTHRRSTAETAMNPIGQTFPVIYIHLGGNSEQPPQLLNVGRFETSSDMRSDHLLFSTETNIQIPTVNNASHIVAGIFHDYGMHHLTCEFKTFHNFSYPTDPVHVASISRMTSTIVFRIRCYVSFITEKYDLSFQLTSDNDCGETCSYSIFQEYTVVLD